MDILVTGAAGFVGRNLIENLKNIRDGKNRTRPGIVIGEIFEYDLSSAPEELDAYCKKADFVFNLAGVNRPEDPEEFKKVFQRISSWIQGKDAYYRFTCDKIPRKVLLKDILYFRSKLRQVEIVCEDNSHLIYQKLNEIERELAAENQKQFLRIHQSYLVNYNHIRCFGHNWVELQTGKRLPMSRGRREVVEKRLEGASM